MFTVPIIRRERLTKEGSDKETYHLELDLSTTNIQYSVGDCVAIYPHNDPELVETILSHFSEAPTTMVTDEETFAEFLTKKANLFRAPRKLYERLELPRTEQLTDLLPCSLSAKEFCSLLAPLLPRFYSIASSMEVAKRRADLTITLSPEGTCSHYLCHRAPLNTPYITLYHEPSKSFCLPPESKDKPIIMVGPGTGIAPFRGFMQERSHAQNWLFFGERRAATDFYYEEEWREYAADGKLRITTAFSRDTEHKIYVQDRMLEHQEELWKWLEAGAYFFVCGDAKQMAKDVDQALRSIIQNQSSHDPKQYIKKLRSEQRYLRDVY